MIIKTIVQRDETGLDMIYEKAKEFDQENALEAIISCKFSKRKVWQVLCLVREYQNRLNVESSELVEFSEHFIEQYSTDNNQCFEIALRLVRKIGTTITGSMKIFRKFCPVIHRKLEGDGNVACALDFTKLSTREYAGEFFGDEPYIGQVKTLLQEMSAFFYHLVTTMALCKEMIKKEREVRGDYEQLMRIFRKSCDEMLKSVNEVVGTFGAVQLVSKEELEERRKHARPLKEWLPSNYHAHDKKWLRREAYILKTIEGGEDGLDETASLLWSHDHAKGREMVGIIGRLDTLGLGFKRTKTEGKAGKFDAIEMVYLIKYSGVSWTGEDGRLVREEKERRFYEYLQKTYRGQYEFPSWQRVCGERKNCYELKMTHQQMADAFAEHLSEPSEQGAKEAVMPVRKHVKFG